MSNSIIEVNNLSKSYTISHEGSERYTALRDVMAQKAKKIFFLFYFVKKGISHKGTKGHSSNDFWSPKFKVLFCFGELTDYYKML